MPNPPVPPGTKIDKSSDYFRYWPKGGQPSLWKLKDNLILAIPPQYQPFWYQKDDVTRAPVPLNQVPQARQTGFTFFMPDFRALPLPITSRNSTKTRSQLLSWSLPIQSKPNRTHRDTTPRIC